MSFHLQNDSKFKFNVVTPFLFFEKKKKKKTLFPFFHPFSPTFLFSLISLLIPVSSTHHKKEGKTKFRERERRHKKTQNSVLKHPSSATKGAGQRECRERD
jgi:hypothetical protein